MSGIPMKLSWLNLFLELVRKPRFGAEQLLQLRLNNFQLLQLSILAICLISIFLFLVVSTFGAILPNSIDLQSNQMDIFSALKSIKPINLVISGVISFIARGVALTYFGQIFKGEGGFRDSILMLAWFDIIHSIGLAIIFIGLWISPTITIMLTLLGTIWLVWIATNFILVLHKFSNIIFVFLGMIFGYFSLHFLLNLVF
tara:strand:+ start:3169 stop:3768 length:600 start_codon:yes stop_codon:yes gene_type:complete